MNIFHQIPLAERMRPRKLEDYIGQDHLVGKYGLISKMLSQGHVPSMIFWGPPGTGKTTLAELLATELKIPFLAISAISAGIKDVREIIEKAKRTGTCVFFIDEIHRFNKIQQDALLGAVEKGFIKLVGATTENPSFEINNALLSRCQIYVLNSFGKNELQQIFSQAIEKDDVLKKLNIKIEETNELMRYSGGDARRLLNLLEITINNQSDNTKVINDDEVRKALHQNALLFDKKGEFHYDIISAFIKSMRGSDPDGAIYWLARMIKGGEDPKFIARRMLIFASEDIGLANPNALLIANTTFDSIQKIGMPEGRIILSNCVIYLATSPKSNSAYMAIDDALALVEKTGNLPVPLHLRNAPTKLMKDLGYGKEYLYPHAFDQNFVNQNYLPSEIENTVFYKVGKNARETEILKFLNSLKVAKNRK